MTRHGLGGPLGEGDFSKGQRVESLLDLAPRLLDVGFVPMFELKGDDLSGDWVKELYAQLKPYGGMLTWHWSNGSTKKLGDPKEPVSAKLRAMAAQAKKLKRTVGLKAVTIHCAPAMAIDPPADAGRERYNSPIGAEEMLAHIKRQVEPLKELNKLCGGILQIETVDITNFRDGGFKLPTYLQLQTGSWNDLLWLKNKAGLNITFDSEHRLCAGNVLMPKRDMRDLARYGIDEISIDMAEFDLEQLAGYWLRKDFHPQVTNRGRIDIKDFIKQAKPRLFHFGGAVQAEIDGEIGTHLPFDPANKEQMDLLDMQLCWILADDKCLGGVTEVVGQLYVDDPANPGHNRYSTWSPRIADDEDAKESAILIIIERLERMRRLAKRRAHYKLTHR